MAHFFNLVAEATTTSSSSYLALLFVVLRQLSGEGRFRAVSDVGCGCAAHHSVCALCPT